MKMNATKPDVLQLNEFYLTKCNVKWNELGQKSEGITFSIDYDVERNCDNDKMFRLTFRFSLSPKMSTTLEIKCSGYEIETEIVGIFFFPDGFEEDDMNLIVRDNGCRILYGILRGEIASITGSFQDNKFVLPTVNMRNIVIDVEKNRRAILGEPAKKIHVKKKAARVLGKARKPRKKAKATSSTKP